MRHVTILITFFSTILPLFAQLNPHQRLREALTLEKQGQFDAAINMTKLVIDSKELNGVELGRAYIMLGSSYRVEGKLSEAQDAFERSICILEREPEQKGDYASALEDYGGFYSDMGQLQVAATLWQKALYLRQQIGDHAAVSQSLTNLAGWALAQRHVHEAKGYLKKASEERKLTNDLSDDDSAVLFETEAWLALSEGQTLAAVAGYQVALELCERTYGEQHWLTGWEHMLRGKAYARSGDISRSLADMREGLAILDHALGRRNPKYFVAQIAYSQVLDRTGSRAEAMRVRATAEQAGNAWDVPLRNWLAIGAC